MGGRGIKNLHYTKPDKQQQRHKKGQAEGGDLLTPVGCQERSEEHTSELQSQSNLVCRLLLEKKKTRQHFLGLGEQSIHARLPVVAHQHRLRGLHDLTPLRLEPMRVLARLIATPHTVADLAVD